MLAGLTLDHHVTEPGAGEPVSLRQVRHALVEHRPAQSRVELVELGQVELGEGRAHRSTMATTRAGAPLAPTIFSGKHATWKPVCGQRRRG